MPVEPNSNALSRDCHAEQNVEQNVKMVCAQMVLNPLTRLKSMKLSELSELFFACTNAGNSIKRLRSCHSIGQQCFRKKKFVFEIKYTYTQMHTCRWLA